MRRVPRARASWLITVAVAALMTACDTQPDVQVVDGTTGKPLEGVYVIATWDIWRPMPVQSHTSCGKVEVVRTDANGHFVVSEHARGMLVRLFGSEVRHLRFYAPGLRVDDPNQRSSDRRVVAVPDSQPVIRRLDYLNDLASAADCGSTSQDRESALTIYKVLFQEAKAAAHTRPEKGRVSALQFKIEQIELGPLVAADRVQQRRNADYREYDDSQHR